MVVELLAKSVRQASKTTVLHADREVHALYARDVLTDHSGQCDEDGVNKLQWRVMGEKPGCPISDDGDISTTEWPARGRNRLHGGITRKDSWAAAEDDAEDDPREASGDEQVVNGNEGDYSMAEDEPVGYRQLAAEGAGCPISDPGGCEHDGREHGDGH